MFDKIVEKIQIILSDHPSASLHVCGGFKDKEWFIHSIRTDEEGRCCHDFSIAYNLTQIVGKTTCFPVTMGHYINLPDLLP